MRVLTGIQAEGFTFTSLIVAILGAMLLLWIVRMLRGGTTHHTQPHS